MKPIYGVTLVTILAFLLLDMPALRAQAPCYVRLEDASGYVPTATQLVELEQAAASLCAAFDSAGFGGQFKVYDFGFYLHHSATTGGYPEPFAQKVAEVAGLSPYYLVFGKETDKSGVCKRFWVDLKLPDTGIFECIDLASLGLRASVEAKLGLLSNAIHEEHGYSPFAYHLGEIVAMDTLIQFVADNATCCDPGSRPANICETCKLSEDDLVSLLLLNQFDVDSCTILSSTGNDNTSLSSHVVGRTNLVIEEESQSHDFDEQLADWIDEYAGANPGTSVVVYVATYSKNCSDFLYLWEQYQANTSNSKAFFCIIGSLGHRGAVYSHMQFSGIAAKPAHEMRPTYEDGDGEDDTFMAFCKNTPLCGQVLPGPSVLASICFEMEYAILRKLPSHQGRFKFFVWTEAHWNVCSNSVHTILDLCGIILDLCDPVNAAVYFLEGDKKNAALSVAATVPGSGAVTTGAKYFTKIAHTSPATNKVYKLWSKKNVDGTLEFSYRGNFEKS